MDQHSLTAARIMRRRVITIGPRASLARLERRLVQEDVGGVAVVDDGELVGVVSRADIVRQLAEEQDMADYLRDCSRAIGEVDGWGLTTAEVAGELLQNMRVGEVMSTDVVQADPDASVQELATIMLRRRVHRVLVTRNGELLGIVTTSDLLRVLAMSQLRLPKLRPPHGRPKPVVPTRAARAS